MESKEFYVSGEESAKSSWLRLFLDFWHSWRSSLCFWRLLCHSLLLLHNSSRAGHLTYVSRYVAMYQINKFFLNISDFIYSQNVFTAKWNSFAGRIWPAGRSLGAPGECYSACRTPCLLKTFQQRDRLQRYRQSYITVGMANSLSHYYIESWHQKIVVGGTALVSTPQPCQNLLETPTIAARRVLQELIIRYDFRWNAQ